MKKITVFALIVFGMPVTNIASAENVRGINIDFVTIGNPENPADTQVMHDGTTGFGSVNYNYRIGKYEVTNAQWNDFIAAAGAPTGNPNTAYDQSAYFTDSQQPANCISWYEASQFCNYLTSGDKNLGAYQLGTDGSININRNAAISVYETIYVLPTNDEWYKAAYYKPDESGYSIYANGTDIAPSTDQARYSIYSSPWNVGGGIIEQNGTYDMMGNVWEWTELQKDGCFGLRGGSYYREAASLSSSYWFGGGVPLGEDTWMGFRIVSVPEPATLLLLGLGGLFLKRKK